LQLIHLSPLCSLLSVLCSLLSNCFDTTSQYRYQDNAFAVVGGLVIIVTLLLHCGYTVVTMLLHCIYNVVTLFSQLRCTSYTLVTFLFYCVRCSLAWWCRSTRSLAR
jgi:hypothetical protein